MEDKTLVLNTPQDWVGLLFHIPDEHKLTGEQLGPFIGELTSGGVIFLRSLNKSIESISVGYTIIGNTLHRHEANYGYVKPKAGSRQKKGKEVWTNYTPGCHETRLTVQHLRICKIEVSNYKWGHYEQDDPRSQKVWIEGETKTSAFKPKEPEKPPEPQSAKRPEAPPAPAADESVWLMI